MSDLALTRLGVVLKPTSMTPGAPRSVEARVETIVLAVVVALTLIGALAGCGDTNPTPDTTAGPAPSSASAPGSDGDDGVKVVALDDFAALALLTLGVTPDLAFDAFGYASTAAVLTDAGVETVKYGPQLNLEAVAAAGPDVLVGVSIPTTLEQQERLAAIAPTTVLEYTDSWQNQLTDLAVAVGREDRAERVLAVVENQVETTRDAVAAAALAGTEISVLGHLDGPFAIPAEAGVGPLLTELGLARPQAQRADVTAGSPFLPVSEEQLSAHDAEHVFLLAGGAYDTAPLVSSPLWSTLGVVKAGEVHEVSAEVWFSASAFATSWVLEDVERVLVDKKPARSGADAVTAFQQFLDDVSAPN